MNPDIKARWVAALRSGQYRQGQGYLAQPGPNGTTEYCCLGVLCEIAVQDGIIQNLGPDADKPFKSPELVAREEQLGLGAPDPSTWFGIAPPGDDDDSSREVYMSNTELPQAVMEWAGLESSNPTFPPECRCPAELQAFDQCECAGNNDNLVGLNDDLKLDFAGIARVIEEQL